MLSFCRAYVSACFMASSVQTRRQEGGEAKKEAGLDAETTVEKDVAELMEQIKVCVCVCVCVCTYIYMCVCVCVCVCII